jgi:hypothetical protein
MVVTPTSVERLGSQADIWFEVDAPRVSIDDQPDGMFEPGASRLLATVDPRTTATAGKPVRLAFDPERVHVFHLQTGRSLRS